ncbi:MAG: tetratricopeptide repeat protein [Gaiellales bacterium]
MDTDTTNSGLDERLGTASLLTGLARYDEAEELLRSVVREARGGRDGHRESLAYEGLGMIATRRGNEAAAAELFQRAVEVGGEPDPAERSELYWELARVRAGLGEATVALAVLERCLERLGDPDADPATRARFAIALSYTHSDLGDYGRAGAVLARVLQTGAEDYDMHTRGRLHYAQARLAQATGQTVQAIAHAERSIAAYAASGDEHATANAHLMTAAAYLDGGDTTPAGKHLAEARTLWGPRPSATDLGFLLVEEARHGMLCGDYELAAARAREAVELLGDLSIPGQLGDALLVLARIYDEQHDDERADRAYTSAIEALKKQNGWHRERARAYRWYGKFLRRVGRTEAALEMLEAASDLSQLSRDRSGG